MSGEITRIRTTSADLHEVYGRIISLGQELHACMARVQRLKEDIEDLIHEKEQEE